MIVHLVEDGWDVIYHRAHALLAAEIGGHWCKEKVPVRFYETLAAIAQHDDLEREWEEDQLTEAGAPLDFMLERESSVDHFEHLIEGALYRGRWVALLTAMHIDFLSQKNVGKPDWDSFLTELKKKRQQWQHELEIDTDELNSTYAFMRWCDRLSLILCQKKLPMSERWLEITDGPDGQSYQVMQWESTEYVTVNPWPFSEDKFVVSVEASHLDQVVFESNDMLVQALKNAEIKTLSWTFAKSTDE
jgi:hypothetical protein